MTVVCVISISYLLSYVYYYCTTVCSPRFDFMPLVASVQVQYFTARLTKENLSGLLSQQLGGEEIR